MKKLLLIVTLSQVLVIMSMVAVIPFFFIGIPAQALISQLQPAAQNPTIDSLVVALKMAKEDTNKVNTLNILAQEYFNGNPTEAFEHSQKALELANRLNFTNGIAISFDNISRYYWMIGDNPNALIFSFKKLKIYEKVNDKIGISSSLGNIANVYHSQSDYPKALEYFLKALNMAEELGNKHLIDKHLGNIGNVHLAQGNYPKALEYYFKALKIAEELGNKQLIARHLGNIGIVYNNQSDYPKALDYYFKALKIDEGLGNKNEIAIKLGNIGTLYHEKGDNQKALDYYFKGLKMNEELENKNGMAANLSNIGTVYMEQADYSKALEYYFKALNMAKELGNKKGIAITFRYIGSLYTKTQKYKQAEEYLVKALALSIEIGALDLVKSDQEKLSDLYSQSNRPILALEHYKAYIAARDSIFNEENTKHLVETQMNFDFEKKEALAKVEQDKKDAIAIEELQQQTMQRNGFIGGFALMLALAGVSYRNYRNKRKAHAIIISQKAEVEHQKALVEEKNKDITDSINYAQRLQQAILPPERAIKMQFKESFILYKPKDIVAGDFYWMETTPSPPYKGGVAHSDGVVFFAAADCTGHGVPGAMVSVVCSNALNLAVKEFGITDPGKILDKVTDLVIETFEKSESEVNDGMDISLCAFNKSTNQVLWAGANNPLWIIRSVIASEAKQSLPHEQIASFPTGVRNDGFQLTEIKPDKQPIGKFANRKPFTSHTISLSAGDTVYLFTDGYADQFGGEKGKKFKYAKLKELLLSIQDKPMSEQKEILNESFETWKGNLEQVDDVCIIGVRI